MPLERFPRISAPISVPISEPCPLRRVNGRDAEQNHVILNSIYLGTLPRRNINE